MEGCSEFVSPTNVLIIKGSAFSLLFFVSYLTFKIYGDNIKGLVISWLVEAVIRIISEIALILHANAYFDEALYLIYWILTEINHLIFIHTVFRMRTVAIYTDLNNDNLE
jgi:hypothetical protein